MSDVFRRKLVAKCPVSLPATPSTDYSTDVEINTPEPIDIIGKFPIKPLDESIIAGKSHLQIDINEKEIKDTAKIPQQKATNVSKTEAFVPRQLFANVIDDEEKFGALRLQILTLQKAILGVEEASRKSKEENMYSLNSAKREIIEKDKTISRFTDKLQKEKLKTEASKDLYTEMQDIFDDATEKVPHLEKKLQKEKLKTEAVKSLISEREAELENAAEKISYLKVMRQKEKVKYEAGKKTIVENKVELETVKEKLNEEIQKVLRRDNTIVELKLMLQEEKEKNQQMQYNHNVQNNQYVQEMQIHQYIQQPISYSSRNCAVISSGGGNIYLQPIYLLYVYDKYMYFKIFIYDINLHENMTNVHVTHAYIDIGDDGPRCKDGSRDMRCKANYGKSKYG